MNSSHKFRRPNPKAACFLWCSVLIFACGSALSAQIEQTGNVPVLRVNVVERTAKAINYRQRAGATKVDFTGTALQPKAYGEAKVETKKGYTEIEVEFDDLEPASKFGPEFLTYVLWAISPEGRPSNLGEILLDKTRDGKLNVTTELQAFGMIVTAEPYFGVTQPSDVVVMENIVRRDTKGQVEDIQAKYELLPRGEYILNVDPSKVVPLPDSRNTLPLLEARNAVQIARWARADQYASDTFHKAETLLERAESYQAQKQTKSAVQTAREAVQTAEDSRLIARKRLDEERLAKEREAAAERDRQAQLRVDEESRMRAEAERAREQAEAARSAAQAQQESARLEAERARQASRKAEQLRQQAEREKHELRTRLTEQLNLVLETRDTARGLIVSLSDVLFDTGKYSLRPGTREKLAKIAGIVVSHPGLKLEVEGHTDSVGGDEYNQRLSENRANSVRDYLIQQGVEGETITAQGFGESQPVASNDTAAGKQQNRRVELVVSGEPIGTTSSLR